MKYILIAAVLATIVMGIQMTSLSQIKATAHSQVEATAQKGGLKRFFNRVQHGIRGLNPFNKFRLDRH